jgi:hypothetical protein
MRAIRRPGAAISPKPSMEYIFAAFSCETVSVQCGSKEEPSAYVQ